MKTKWKVLLTTLCALLLIVGSAVGTLAYLTSQDAVTNTFTVGEVTLGSDLQKGLDEALVNEYGQPINNDTDKTPVELAKAPRVQENDYKLVPGRTYIKDPTVHVNPASEDCYVFVKVENGIAAYEAAAATGESAYTPIADQITGNGWSLLKGVADVYYQVYTKSDDGAELPVFGRFRIAGDANEKEGWADINKNQPKIIVTAYAVQKEGFAAAGDAWNAAFGTQNAASGS